MNDPILQEHEGIVVVRDDLLPGGTKSRFAALLFEGVREAVYASPVYGYAQIALAIAAKELGKRATIFCAQRKEKHPRTLAAIRHGANVVEVPHGYLSVVQANARRYCGMFGHRLIPFGLDSEEIIVALSTVAASLPIVPTEVWSVAGSGVLQRAMQRAWPLAQFNAVQVGHVPNAGRARVFVSPQKFEQDAKLQPPFPSCSNYDAKAWAFIKKHATPGALFWNVAA
jgi:hypothetical protein